MCLSAAKKTNILFHPTPSVSYESMYVQLEKRTYILCGRVLLSIVVLGKLFGGTLHALIPLGLCVSSGIFLWMRELVTKGRSHEWSSETARGKMVSWLKKLALYSTDGCRPLLILFPNLWNE
jgi:hypothetical protein